MGGRGSSSRLKPQSIVSPTLQGQRQKRPQPNPQVAQQAPDTNNTPVTPNAIDALTQMTDAQLAANYLAAQQATMPNHLSDRPDITQQFVFYNGINAKPQVLDSAAFSQFMQQNGIPQSNILSRSVNGGILNTSSGGQRTLTPKDVADMMMRSRLNYIGGKHGGQVYGAGTYFDMNGGGNTGYGSGVTVNAVLNPRTAKIIGQHQLFNLAQTFDASHPQFAKATGGIQSSNQSIYALVMGYNVIKSDYNSYHNVIDRSALVYRE